MCTRALSNEGPLGVVTSRTMDWPESTQPKIWWFPRGMMRDGGLLGASRVDAENPMRWTSEHASLATSVYDLGTVDGLNEKGLGLHVLYLNVADFGPRDPKLPGIQGGLVAQYLLDRAATVTRALELIVGIQPIMVEAHGRKTTVHYAMEDASGDSAIVEHIDGEVVIHHGRQHRIMTNDPSYEEQLALLAAIDMSKPSSDLPIGGNVNPRDRFQRATYYARLLPQPRTIQESIAGVLAIARNVSVPFGAPYQSMGIYNTEYRTVVDSTHGTYYFELSTSPSVIWIDLDQLGVAAGQPVLGIDPTDPALTGNVTSRLRPARAPF